MWALLDPQLLLLAVAALLTYAYLTYNKKYKLPPGPTPWPIIGNMLDLKPKEGKAFYEQVLDLRRQYGDVVYLRLGPFSKMVFIMGKENIYKATVAMDEKFKYRPNNMFVINHIFNNSGVILSNGEVHTALRKLVLGTMRDFGVGKRSLEERIQEEARMLVDHIETFHGEPTLYMKVFKMAVSNIISGIVYGDRLDYDDPQLSKLIADIDNFFKKISVGLPENFFPILRFLPGSKMTEVVNNFKHLEAYARTRIEEHRATFDPTKLRDFVDLFLKYEHSDNEKITEYAMFRVIIDLFNAGTDTTATGLAWAVLELVRHPHIQDKCRAELMANVGSERQVRLEDKENLPYLQAFIMEILRFSTIAPQTIPHFTKEDVEFNGYTIPKNTSVMFLLYSVLMSKEEWGDPEVFRPERFLGDDGKLLEKAEGFIPFSLGARSCLGKHLARMELFIFLATLIQRLEFKTPAGADPPSDKRIQTGITSQPVPYQMCAISLAE